MATILLSAAGAAIGGAVGGSVLGLSSVVIGRAVGATVGRIIDQRLMGAGSEVVEVGKLSRYRVTGASEGSPMSRTYARTRVGGQVIWATRFKERVRTRDVGGKGGGGGATAKTYSYSVSLAVALGEGPILRVGRVWADGIEVGRDQLDMRVYPGDSSQLPDPLIEAVEGSGNAPAHRGTAYVVIEDMELAAFGNRVPQLSFEVVRPTDEHVVPEDARSLSGLIRGVALVPGSGEYVLEPGRVTRTTEAGRTQPLNHSAAGLESDFRVAMRQLDEELPSARSVAMVMCWFGNDLRCENCTLRPKVEQSELDADTLPWFVSGVGREQARVVPYLDGRPVYGGTPTDQSVVAAIEEMRAAGRHVVFYPFILMDQMIGNDLPDPWTGSAGQPHLPWRGRITTSQAPGRPGTPDRTTAAEAEVAAFFGSAQPGDFEVVEVAPPASGEEGGEEQDGMYMTEPTPPPSRPAVAYTGPEDWGYRRFILHYAHLCRLAGGVDAFCIGSEMRGLTRIRGAGDTFPAVAQLKALASEVRAILGPECRIGYAADWSEYYGYHPGDGSGDVFFNLDPLWADPAIDFVGIDNYMPLSDWRDGLDHLDAQSGVSSIYDIGYLKSGVAGGEGYDWYYPDHAARDAQARVPIEDGAHGEPWVFRYKDLRGWWENSHHERIGGVRQTQPTDWVPMSKPIWFTEFGCAAIDRGTNQPNKFLDPKSSESRLPYHADGRRDELIQAQYLRAVISYWENPENNPTSPLYGGSMLDMSRAHVWAWDTRPFPHFPNRLDLWSDGENYARGHWLNGRTSSESLAAVIADICARAGLRGVDVSRVYGLVRGYEVGMGEGARAALQPLLLAYGIDAAEREGTLRFAMRTGRSSTALSSGTLAVKPEIEGDLELSRAPAAESPGRVRLGFVRAGGDFETAATEAAFPGEEAETPASSEMPLVLGEAEAQGMAERWLAEGRVARDAARFALPPSALGLGAGDVVALEGANWRIDRVEMGEGQLVEAVRVEPGAYETAPADERPAHARPTAPPIPVAPVFLDLPLMTGEEVPHAPHLAVAAEPWVGPVAVMQAPYDADYALDRLVEASATIGVTLDPLPAARPGRWDRGAALRVRFATGGGLASVEPGALLSGANLFAIGDGRVDGWELFQAARAELVAPDTYELSMRLRGQLGTEADMAPVRPAGARVIAIDRTLVQVGLPASARGLDRHFRIGPAGLPLDDPAWRHVVSAFQGVGLRPYAPVHPRIRERADGAIDMTWIRRTRIGGDSWLGEEVPLGEDLELYRVRVLAADGSPIRETDVSSPQWRWEADARAADAGAVALAVAQVSQAFGAGPYRRIEIDG